MDFLKRLRASIYGPDFYEELKGRPLSYSMKYFFAFIAWLAVIAAVLVLFRAIPAVNAFLSGTEAGVVGGYPDGLVITVASGSVSTNMLAPYAMPLSATLRSDMTALYDDVSSTPVNLLVVDTKDPLTVGEFQNDRTLLLLSSDSLAYAKDAQGQSVVIQPIDSDVSFTVDKAAVVSVAAKASEYFKLVDGALVVLAPIGIFLAMVLRLVYLFFFAVIIWAIAQISRMNIGYGQVYRWGIHLMTLPLLVTTALWLVFPYVCVPFLFTLLALAAAAVNLKGEIVAKKPEEQVV